MTAADKILQKALVGSGLDSRQWSAVQAGLRDRAFFSATVEDVRVLGAFRDAAARLAAGETDPSSARIAMRDALAAAGYRPPDAEDQGPGGIRNMMSQRRLDLILKTNVEQARGWAQYMEGTTEGALLAYPAQRLVRVRQRRMPRDWAARWKEAGDAVGWQGACRDEFVALKLSPIWAQLSRFGTPYPPFDFNSGMGVEDVGKRKARELGLLEGEGGGEGEEQGGAGAQSPSVVPSFNANLQATVPNIRSDSEEGLFLKRAFGDQVKIQNGVVSWEGELMQGIVSGKVDRCRLGDASGTFLAKCPEELRDGFAGRGLSLSRTFFEQHGRKHMEGNEHRRSNMPLSAGDYELLPTVWRSPERVLPGDRPERVVLELDTIDGGILALTVDVRDGIKSYFKRKNPLEAPAANARLSLSGSRAGPGQRTGRSIP